MENKPFIYQYSARRNKEVENIRKKYLPREESKLERLRRIDRQVQGAGRIESLTLGVIGVLVFGTGMCYGLGVFGAVWWPAIPFGIIGVSVMLCAYPLYKRLYNKKKEALTPEILRLSEEIIKS